MPRSVEWRAPLLGLEFTPIQMQTRELLHASHVAMMQWLTTHVCAVTELWRHNAAVVAWAVDLEFGEPLTFFQTTGIDIRALGRLRRRGAQFQAVVEFSSGGKVIARVTPCMRPLWVSSDGEMAGMAAPWPEAITSRFKSDEVDPSEVKSPIPELVQAIESRGEKLADGELPFKVYRHNMDPADQWRFDDVPCFIGASRDELSLSDAPKGPVRNVLHLRMKSLNILLSKPCYLFDTGKVQSKAYRVDGRIAFVHRLVSDAPPFDLFATAVEQFEQDV